MLNQYIDKMKISENKLSCVCLKNVMHAKKNTNW